MIQFTDGDGKRRTIRLGKITKADAGSFKGHVERLVSAKAAGHAPDLQTSTWLSAIASELRAKLEAAGLVGPAIAKPTRPVATLGEFCREYVASRTDLKPRSRDIVERARTSLVSYFGENKPLREITRADCKRFRRWLREQGGVSRKGVEGGKPLARNTANDRLKKAKAMFDDAVDGRLIRRNPFDVLKKLTVRANPSRFYYVPADDVRKVIDNAVDPDFGLLLALCRFAGLRNPSETTRLTWGDINLHEGRMLVHSPKTEHYEGKDSRLVPITDELRPYLEAAWDRAPEGAVNVLPWTAADKNFGPRAHRAIIRAGLPPWPKTFQNLRSSRQTDWQDILPDHVVCAWMGNTARVAREHYLQVTPEHWERATSGEALQKALQQPSGSESSEGNAARDRRRKVSGTPDNSNLYPSVS